MRFTATAYLVLLAALVLAGCSRLSALTGGAETTANSTAAVPATATRAAQPSPQANQTTPPPQPTETVLRGTVTIWHSWDERDRPALAQIIQDFQAEYPNIQFDVQYLPVEILRPRFEAAALEGGGPTLLLGPAEWGPSLYDAGLLADLSDLAGQELLDTVNLAGLGSAQYQGALVGLPYTIQGVVLYRNRNVIIDRPSSLEDLISLAKGATAGDVIGAVLDRSLFFSGAHLNGIGGEMIAPDGSPAFDDEKGIAWLEMLQAFSQAGPSDYFTNQDLELFKTGKVGFIIDGTWNREVLADAIGPNNLMIDPWPAYKDGYLSGYVQSENLYLSAQAAGENRTATWLFSEYFLSAEAQSVLAGLGHIPAANGAAIADPFTDPVMAQAIAALADGMPYPVHPQFSLYTVPLDKALKSVFEQRAQPADALRVAYNEVLAAQAGVQPTPAP